MQRFPSAFHPFPTYSTRPHPSQAPAVSIADIDRWQKMTSPYTEQTNAQLYTTPPPVVALPREVTYVTGIQSPWDPTRPAEVFIFQNTVVSHLGRSRLGDLHATFQPAMAEGCAPFRPLTDLPSPPPSEAPASVGPTHGTEEDPCRTVPIIASVIGAPEPRPPTPHPDAATAPLPPPLTLQGVFNWRSPMNRDGPGVEGESAFAIQIEEILSRIRATSDWSQRDNGDKPCQFGVDGSVSTQYRRRGRRARGRRSHRKRVSTLKRPLATPNSSTESIQTVVRSAEEPPLQEVRPPRGRTLRMRSPYLLRSRNRPTSEAPKEPVCMWKLDFSLCSIVFLWLIITDLVPRVMKKIRLTGPSNDEPGDAPELALRAPE